ncbi:MAG: hypothetical protein U0R19_21750 [Bryobacteraceae bacterium]
MRRATIALTVLFVAMLGGMVWSMRRANLMEDERTAAELRMVKIRDFLGKNLPELKGTMEYLPGSGKARLALLAASREYLADLVKEGAADPKSRAHLAAYHQLTADLEASLAASDLSYYDQAAENYRKAIDLRQDLKDDSEAGRATLIDLHGRLAQILQQFGKFSEAKTALRGAPTYRPGKDQLASTKQKAARLFSMRAYIALHEKGAPGAEEDLRRAVGLVEGDTEPQGRYELARATRLLAMLYGHQNRSVEAQQQAVRSVDTGQALLQQFPARDDYRRGLAASRTIQAGLVTKAEAERVILQAYESAAFVVAGDPYDVQAGSEFINITLRMAAADHERAEGALEQTRQLTAPLLEHFPKSYTAATDQVNLAVETARFYRRKGQMKQALEALKRVLPVATEQAATYPGVESVRGRLRAVQDEMSAVAGGAK